MAAQETPKIELFGGYSFTRANLLGDKHVNLNGWNASVAYNLNKWVGIVVDGSGAYRSRQVSPQTVIIFVCPIDPTHCPPGLVLGPTNLHQEVHTYSIGPQFSYRTDSRFTPFAHVLFGGGYTSNNKKRDYEHHWTSEGLCSDGVQLVGYVSTILPASPKVDSKDYMQKVATKEVAGVR